MRRYVVLLCPMHRLPLLSSSHFGPFSVCFRTTADVAADPPFIPAATIIFQLSGEITVRSRAAENQLGTKMSAGLV